MIHSLTEVNAVDIQDAGFQRFSRGNKIISYDKDADVLYITLGDREGVAEEVENGVFLRYVDKYNLELIGITIMNFKERYITK